MGRKKYKKDFVDLRGRWIDNQRLLHEIIDLACSGSDWTVSLKPLLADDSYNNVRKVNSFQYPPDLRFAKLDGFDNENVQLKHANLTKATAFRSKFKVHLPISCSNYAANKKWTSSV